MTSNHIDLRDHILDGQTMWCAVEMANGEITYTSIERKNNDVFRFRVESGWYWEYSSDGTRVNPPCRPSKPGRNIAKITPMTFAEFRAKYPDFNENDFHP